MQRRAEQQQRGRSRHGQSLVELALVLPLIALILVGVGDLGRVYFSQVRLTNAVREGAIYGAYAPNPIADVAAQAYTEANGQLGQTGNGGDFVVTVTCYNGTTNTTKACNSPLITPGDTIAVVGTYTFRPYTSQIIRILGDTITIRKTARMPIM